MRRLTTIVLIATATIITCLTVDAQVRDLQSAKEELWIAPLSRHPGLGVDYSSIARVKLASRKETYHLREMISLDVAILNRSKASVFLLSALTPNFHLQDENGKEVIITPYGFPARGITASLFTLVEPNEIITEYFDLLAGCDQRAFDQLYSNPETIDDLKAFNDNLFVNWGRACLRIEHPGTYFIVADIRNDYVINSLSKKKVKTAVGRIKSNLLKITVVE